MTRIRKTLTAAVLLGASLGPLQAAETLKFAHVYETATPYHEAAQMAAKDLEARTKGRYTMKVFPASSLGKEVAINEGLALGTVDVIYTGVGFAGSAYGPLSISDYPFTLRDFAHWDAYRQSDLFKELTAEYTKKTGSQVFTMTYYGARHVTANKAILKPADMKDLKIRVPNAPAYVMFPKAVGANPTPMAFSEVYLALQQGVVDAQENPLPTIKFKKFYEVQKHINLTGHITNSLITVVSGRRLKKMSAEDQQILREVLDKSARWASQEIHKSEQELAAWFREQGVTVNEVDRKPFMAAVAPVLTGNDVPWPKDVYDRLQTIGK